jgi:hypothetical protein
MTAHVLNRQAFKRRFAAVPLKVKEPRYEITRLLDKTYLFACLPVSFSTTPDLFPVSLHPREFVRYRFRLLSLKNLCDVSISQYKDSSNINTVQIFRLNIFDICVL